MAAELWDILDFLEQLPSFQSLDEATRTDLPRRMQVRYLRHDSMLDEEKEGGAWLLRIGAIEVRDNLDGRLVDRIAEGGLILTEPLRHKHQNAALLEDSLLYHLPSATLAWLHERYPNWPGGEQRACALHHAEPAPSTAGSRLDIPLSRLPLPRAPTCGEGLSIRDAAQLMTEQRSDTLLVERPDGLLSGIVTDRDLRERVVAGGTDPDQPIVAIASSPVQCIHHDLLAAHALDRMSRGGFHHLPVLDETGRARWLFSDDILVEVLGEHGIRATKHLQRAQDIDDLMLAWRHTPKPLDQPAAIPLHIRLAQYNQRLKLMLQKASRLLELEQEPEPCGALAANELLPGQPPCLHGLVGPLREWLERQGLNAVEHERHAPESEQLIGFFRDAAIDAAGQAHPEIDLLRQVVEPIRTLAKRYPLDLTTEGCETILRLQQAAEHQPDAPQFTQLIRACEQAWVLAMRRSHHGWPQPLISVATLEPAERHILRQGLQAYAELQAASPPEASA